MKHLIDFQTILRFNVTIIFVAARLSKFIATCKKNNILLISRSRLPEQQKLIIFFVQLPIIS